MGQIQVEKNVGGIEGLCVIQPACPPGRMLWQGT